VHGRGAHIETHQFEGLRLLHQSFGYGVVRLPDQGAERGLVEFKLRVRAPQLGHWRVHAAHARLEIFVC